MTAESLVDEIWGEAPAQAAPAPVVVAEPDPIEDEDELVPLGLVLREMELDQREAEMNARQVHLITPADIEAQGARMMSAALGELLLGVRTNDLGAQRDHWMLLAWMAVEDLHGGAFRVWDPKDRDWRTVLRRRCSKRGCKWCPRGAS